MSGRLGEGTVAGDDWRLNRCGQGDELSALVTYDNTMVTAASRRGYGIVQPR